jgi:hypothetical protein
VKRIAIILWANEVVFISCLAVFDRILRLWYNVGDFAAKTALAEPVAHGFPCDLIVAQTRTSL